MKIRLASDLHTEFWNFNKFERMMDLKLPHLPDDKETILLLAGDIGTFAHYASTIKPALNILSKRFKHVIYVYGNHEWYNSAIWGGEERFWADKKIPKNVTILANDYKIIDEVAFIGSTLWTDFNNGDPMAMIVAGRGMNDYHCIKYEVDPNPGPYSSPIGRKLMPETTVDTHRTSKAFLFKAIELLKPTSRKLIVVTHHMPSEQSVPKRFAGDSLNPAFFTELSEDILNKGPDIWLHGHTHDSCDYMIGETRVVCNPFGYHAQQENKMYDPKFLMEV